MNCGGIKISVSLTFGRSYRITEGDPICTYCDRVGQEPGRINNIFVHNGIKCDSVTCNCPVSANHVKVTGTESVNSDIVVTLGTAYLLEIIAGPREARNPNLDSDQWIVYNACAPRL